MDNITVFSVFEVTRHLRQVIESSIEPLYVAGEISSFVHHSSGHMYFNIKDENATLRCTFFKGANYRLDFKPADGMQVVCFGKITVFEKGGTYNLNVQNMSQAGLGLMQQKFEALKRKLQQEGLFEQIHKQIIPKFPDRIGIVTSPTGAALQDIQNIIMRRYPVELIVYPALMQGSDAPSQIIKGIEHFNRTKDVDFIIVTRGGGSQEDLFCFNDEALARAIFASQLPIISAVGHEIDFTLADFVADLRAPTPSAAAELAVPDKKELLALLNSLGRRINLAAQNKVSRLKTPLHEAQMDLAKYHPEKLWQSYQQRFDLATIGLSKALEQFGYKKTLLQIVSERSLARFQTKMEMQLSIVRTATDKSGKELVDIAANYMLAQQNRIMHSESLLQQLSPQKTMRKGWIMARKAGNLVTSVHQLKAEDSITLSFADGIAESTVNSIQEKQ